MSNIEEEAAEIKRDFCENEFQLCRERRVQADPKIWTDVRLKTYNWCISFVSDTHLDLVTESGKESRKIGRSWG
jgi:hypothetical protein